MPTQPPNWNPDWNPDVIAEKAASLFVERFTVADVNGGSALLGSLVFMCVIRAFGCTCTYHGPQLSTKDRGMFPPALTCPIHGPVHSNE